MVKTLKKHGNSQALVIEKSILDAMGIDADPPLQVTVSGQTLIVTPADIGVGPEAVTASVRKLRRRYGKMLKRLAE